MGPRRRRSDPLSLTFSFLITMHCAVIYHYVGTLQFRAKRTNATCVIYCETQKLRDHTRFSRARGKYVRYDIVLVLLKMYHTYKPRACVYWPRLLQV